MKILVGLILALMILVPGCAQSNNSDAAQAAQVKFVMNGEELTLSQPSLLKNGEVYMSMDDTGNLPGISVDYNQSTGEITAKPRRGDPYEMKIDQPLKAGDKKGATPFINQGTVYLPICFMTHYIGYDSQIEKTSDGKLSVTLKKLFIEAYDLWPAMKGAELAAAEAALANGVTITDPAGDLKAASEGIQPDGRPDNPHPYQLPFTDIRKVTFGADSQYLYLKVEVDGVLPEKMLYLDNTVLKKSDYIHSMCCNLGLMNFQNRNTGKNDEGLMQLGVSWVEGDPRDRLENPTVLDPPVVAISNFATVTGQKDKNGEDTYATAVGDGKTSGGAGKTYFMGAFPLKLYGLQLGDTIEFCLGIETGSKIFHHASIDEVLDNSSKAGNTIRWQIGAGTYDDLGPPKM
jgi:hypothetical protein